MKVYKIDNVDKLKFKLEKILQTNIFNNVVDIEISRYKKNNKTFFT